MNNNYKNYVIIVGGGSGSRMGSSIPKQFMILNGLPILMHTIKAFQQADLELKILLVLNEKNSTIWHQLCTDYDFNIPYTLINGGSTRFGSVKNALDYLRKAEANLEEACIAVHDGVRPLISKQTINKAFVVARVKGAVCTALPSKDSVRLLSDEVGTSSSLDRGKVYLVQTPQVFKAPILLKAYEQANGERFNDDASVVEYSGHPIHLIPGDARNIKITFKEDMVIAEAYLNYPL